MTKTLLNLVESGAQLQADTFSDDVIFQVWLGERLQVSSVNAPTERLSLGTGKYYLSNVNAVQWRTTSLVDADKKIVVIYGERNDSYNKIIDSLVVRALLPIFWVLPVLGVFVWLIVGLGLKPLRRFVTALAERSAGELKPMNLHGYPKELKSLLESTNALFIRLDSALQRETRFAADAAHELRTPLAALKVNLYNYSQSVEGNSQSPIILDMISSLARMEGAIEQILALYQLNTENFQRTICNCELMAICQEAVLLLYHHIQEKQIEIQLVGSEVNLQADSNSLLLLLKNVIENSVKYTPVSGEITISLSQRGGDLAVITLEDSGPGIAKEDYSRVLQRFYRTESAQQDGSQVGSGLGLSIAKQVVALHQGSIEFSKSSDLGGLSLEITLPLSQQLSQLNISE